jgi:uncharacterized membrane protein
MRSMSDRRALALAALALASAFCGALLVARWVYSEPGAFRFLAWNLFLAWIPLVAAVVVYDMHRRGVGLARMLPVAAAWLLFLPNAPYLLTDLIHLGSRDDAPLWYDLVLFSAFAWTGALLGFLSVYLLQVVVRRAAGYAWSWAFVGASLLACAFGMYLGRSLRWNSWEVVTNPEPLLSDVWARLSDPLAHPRTLGMTVALTALLTVMYLVLYAFAQLPSAERSAR